MIKFVRVVPKLFMTLYSAAVNHANRLDLRSAAVNKQFNTRDETGVIRSQKQRGLRNFDRLPHASHRDGGDNTQSPLQIADSRVAY